MHGPAVLFCMNVVLTAGPYNGSTFTVVGRDNIVDRPATGAFDRRRHGEVQDGDGLRALDNFELGGA